MSQIYAGFNLIVGDFYSIHYISNRYSGEVKQVGRGLSGLSNALLETPWGKVTRGKEEVQEILDEYYRLGLKPWDLSAEEEGSKEGDIDHVDQDEKWLVEQLFTKILSDGTPCEVQKTGYPRSVESQLSKIFVPGCKPFAAVKVGSNNTLD